MRSHSRRPHEKKTSLQSRSDATKEVRWVARRAQTATPAAATRASPATPSHVISTNENVTVESLPASTFFSETEAAVAGIPFSSMSGRYFGFFYLQFFDTKCIKMPLLIAHM